MKNIIISALILLSGILSAQKTVEVKIVDKAKEIPTVVQAKIEQYTQKIDSLVMVEKAAMKTEIEALTLKKDHGEISESEAETQKQVISDKYTQRINDKLTTYQSELESIIETQVQISVKDISSPALVMEKDNSPKKIKYIDLLFSLGFTSLVDGNNLNSMNQSDISFGKSTAFAFGPRINFQPTLSSHFVFSTGLIFKWNNLKTEDNLIFVDNNNATELTNTVLDIKKSKLRMSKMYIPLRVSYSFGKSKTLADGTIVNYPDRGFRIGLGMYAGLNLNTKSIYKYKENGSTEKQKIKDDFNVNKFFYGAEFNIGYNDWTLYVQKDLVDTFENYNYNTNQGVEFGIRYGF